MGLKARKLPISLQDLPRNDTVREGWAIFDFPGLLKQLGKDFYEIARKHNQTVTPTPA